MARGGGQSNSALDLTPKAPEWAQMAVRSAEMRGREKHTTLRQQDLSEQKKLYGRILQPVELPDSCLLAALELEQMVESALNSGKCDKADEIYKAWLASYSQDGHEEHDFGIWLIARECAMRYGEKNKESTLRYLLAMQRTRDKAHTLHARRLERRWLKLLGTESLWEILARAEVESGTLPTAGPVRVNQKCQSDRIKLSAIHDSYKLWVQDGVLNAKHRFCDQDHISLCFKDDDLFDIWPGGLSPPGKLNMPEGSSFYVARAKDFVEADTVVQLHPPSKSDHSDD